MSPAVPGVASAAAAAADDDDDEGTDRRAARASSASSRGSLLAAAAAFAFAAAAAFAAAFAAAAAFAFAAAFAAAAAAFAFAAAAFAAAAAAFAAAAAVECFSSRETRSAFLPLGSKPQPSVAARSCATVIFEGGSATLTSSGAQRDAKSLAGLALSTSLRRAAGKAAITPLRKGWQFRHA